MYKFLSISEMASIHHLSRQTLIHYDKIGLFKPHHIDDKGYRYYSPKQIPYLREIYFLKSIGIKLEFIKDHIGRRDINSTISLLEHHEEIIDRKISQLMETKEAISHRLDLYKNASFSDDLLFEPVIEEFQERKVIFSPFSKEIGKEELHLTLMKSWEAAITQGILPSRGFGTIIKNQDVSKGVSFEGAGTFVSIPANSPDVKSSLTIPGGKYICIYKYGMPYDTDHLLKLLKWISDEGYEPAGDIVDLCLLDTTFYTDDKTVDFCQIQVPVS